MKVSARTVKQHIAKLKKDGILIRIGSTKAGHWEIADENRNNGL